MSDQTPTPDPSTPPAAPPTPQPPVAPPAPQAAPTFKSLDDLPRDLRNQLEAEHKRGLQKQLADATSQLENASVLRDQVSELMKTLPEGTEQDDVADGVKATLSAMQTEKEKLEAANRTASDKISAAEAAAAENLLKYQDAITAHQFSAETGQKASSEAAAELIAMYLKPRSSVGDDGSVSVKMDVTNEDGHTEKDKAVTVKEAVALMEANVTQFGPLFKATQNSGGGGDLVNGVQRTSAGELDLGSLTPEKFFELNKSNPELLEQAAAKALRG